MIKKKEITAVILAGGMARRMQGNDKGLIEFAGVPMVARIIEQLSPQCNRIMINANRNTEKYRKFGLTVFSDKMANYQGPLSGMHTGLGMIDTPWMVTIPCDGPFVSEQHVHRMREAADSEDVSLAVASFAGRLQPVYALINQILENHLQTFLETGERKIDRWYHQHRFATVDLNDTPETFSNINTPEELQKAEETYLKI